ncbi:MAG TPA: acetyl-CoA carboxylase biotin carboxylase subunit [Candidatus Udaeobacter sp.]|jgi:acetyl-CoA carboxylase biotin carboxylase subunit|nr:acetyl-CoA carboxylase biotin carboxylase subunit [Methylomirabilota bacterium]HWN83339.1 acetyl-CoA carboxylase biotin carboxylase subunit [Candidatus Udaeobacter sp.]
MFHKILIANRGEIALRVIRTCREMGIRTVIAHSTADADSLPVRLADESVCIGPPEARGSYLNIPSIISAAAITDSEAIHPGYGLLSENAAFAEICRACGITFIGPAPEAIRLMGDKAQAREMAKHAGAPVVPGSEGPVAGVDEAQGLADSIGYPVMVKAAAGGGGRGMRIVREREDLARAYATCQAEAGAAFGSSDLYLEKYVEDARHVEVQVLGDKSGMRLHLGERDCSVQRRHQKLLEESPAPALPPDTRTGLYKAALAVANAVNYVSAGTVEFLVDREGNFYFIEMNTRIQVEHPVTEMVTGLDIVREQIRIATGEPLGYKQSAVRFAGHAIECRINAEDPEHFVPSPGRISAWLAPGGPGVRVDSHLMAGYVVPPHYDSLIAKIIVHAHDRSEAIARMHRALSEIVIEGVKTTIPYHLKLLADPTFVAGESTLARLEQNL